MDCFVDFPPAFIIACVVVSGEQVEERKALVERPTRHGWKFEFPFRGRRPWLRISLLRGFQRLRVDVGWSYVAFSLERESDQVSERQCQDEPMTFKV